MSTDAKDAIGILEQTKTLMEEEERIRKKMGLIRWVFPLLIVSIFGIYFYMFYNAIDSIEEEKFFTRLQANMVRVWPKIGEELRRVGANLYPHYTEEIGRTIANSAPDLQAKLAEEMGSMKSNLEARVNENLSRALADVSKEQEEILVSELPELENDEKARNEVLGVVNNATISWVKNLFSKTIQEHTVAFLDLKEILDRDYRLDDAEKEKIDTEKLLTLWIEVMDESIRGEATLIEEDKPKRRGKGGWR